MSRSPLQPYQRYTIAISNGDWDTIHAIEASEPHQDLNSEAAVRRAIENGDDALVRHVMERCMLPWGKAAQTLHGVLAFGKPHHIDEFLRRYVHPDSLDSTHTESALRYASTEAFESLVSYGLDASSEDVTFRAITHQRSDILAIQRDLGLDLMARLQESTLCQNALSKLGEEGAALVYEVTSNTVKPLAQVLLNSATTRPGKETEAIRCWVRHGGDFASTNDYDRQRLMDGQSVEWLNDLINNGLDPCAKSSKLLRDAAVVNNEHIASRLIELGANVRYRSDLALKKTVEGGAESVANLLVEHGANPINHSKDLFRRVAKTKQWKMMVWLVRQGCPDIEGKISAAPPEIISKIRAEQLQRRSASLAHTEHAAERPGKGL